MNTKKFDTFEKKINATFTDKSLLVQAFTHRSYLNENRGERLSHNERLEFLGDAVLELVVTDFLYNKFPELPEGELTAYRSALVNTSTLSSVATGLLMNDYLLLSRGEAKDTGRARQYILANTFEAVIGALYMDKGYDAALSFIKANLFPLLDDILKHHLYQDSKSHFQEVAQDKVGITPKYETLEETGPDHNKEFTVGVYLDSELVAKGIGQSKQEAEQKAAENGLKARGWG